MAVTVEEPRTTVRWSQRGAVWALGALAIVVLSWSLASNRVYQSPNEVDHATVRPSLGSVLWIVVPLLLLWTLVVVAGPVARALRAREGGAALAGLACLGLPVLFVVGYVAYDSAVPGCGTPHRSLLTPLPDGVEVVSEDSDFIGISGPGRYRGLIVRSDGASQDDLFQLLVDHYRGLGWPLEVGEDVDGRYAFAELGHYWWLDIDTGYVEDDRTVSIELDHTPTTDRGCLRL